jgi:hypothetical protein
MGHANLVRRLSSNEHYYKQNNLTVKALLDLNKAYCGEWLV